MYFCYALDLNLFEINTFLIQWKAIIMAVS